MLKKTTRTIVAISGVKHAALYLNCEVHGPIGLSCKSSLDSEECLPIRI